MVFADLLFIFIFLPVCLLFYFITDSLKIRNFVLIAFSLIFYAWGEPVWVTLLIFSSVVDYFTGRIIAANKGKPAAKAGLMASVIINLGILALFKYSGFFVENINSLIGTEIPVPSFRMPIGISFYTFQTMSYSIGVYMGKAKVQKSFPRFLMYVSLFPQLIAGPIVRYEDVESEINFRRSTAEDISAGIFRFVEGLAKKAAFANAAGKLAAQYMDGDLSRLSVPAAWFGVVMFALQIYFDFSGYSDMAIGLGRIFGFHFLENFNYPYISKTITEFWRRWHISLSSFFRDYVYIPLGGNRKHQYLNLLAVWFLTGLWHGASWNFIFWGLFYFVFIVLERLFLFKFFEKIPRIFGHIYTLIVVLVGWDLFYFTDLSRLGQHLKAMFFMGGAPIADAGLEIVFFNNIFWIILAIALCAPIKPALESLGEKHKRLGTSLIPVRTVFCVFIFFLSVALLAGQSYNPFIYWRF